MTELLVKALSAVHPNAEKDRRGSHKKGDIIVVKDDGHIWGAGEGLPNFVIVKCPGLATATVEDKLAPWVWAVNFEVLNSNLALDGHRIKMTNATQSPGGGARLTIGAVTTFIGDWGGTVVTDDNMSVTFDITIASAATSASFWGTAVSDVSFTEQSYVQGSGVHAMTMDYSAHPTFLSMPTDFEQSIATLVPRTGAVLVSQGPGLVTFTVTRAGVRERFRADVTSRLGVWQRHRYHFTSAQVDTVIAGGGTITVTQPQLVAAVQDRQAA